VPPGPFLQAASQQGAQRHPFSAGDPLVLKRNKSQHTAYFSSITREKKSELLVLYGRAHKAFLSIEITPKT
jgi:hypothetical protein